MKIVNIHEAKTHLSRLAEEAARGEPFIIAKAGKPLVKVVPLDTPPARPQQRLGFLKGRISVPADFDRMYEEEIQRLFESFLAEPKARDIRSLKGIVSHTGNPVSVEDMNASIARMGQLK